MATFNFVNFLFWQFNNLAIFNFDNSGNFGNFQFWQLQFWQLSISKLSVLTIFNFGYFQAKFLNGYQQQQINFMDLAIKNIKKRLQKIGKNFYFSLA